MLQTFVGSNSKNGVSMMARNLRWCGGSVLVLLIGFFGSGCGEGDELPREAVSGTVNLDGKPLEKGSIQFSPVQGNPGAAVEGGGLITAGKYAISKDRGLVPGTYQIAIYAGGSRAAGKGAMKPETGGPAPSKEPIPAKYNARTELKKEVKKGIANEINFELTSQ
jgi:hypothetical protein